MKLRVDKFCSLATSPSWQAWLYRFDASLYREFIVKLQSAKGCSGNKEIMLELLKRIEAMDGGADKLEAFISKNYAHMMITDDATPRPVPVQSQTVQQVFQYYNPNLLTYPRRIVFEGDERSLAKTINEFVLDKIKYDSLILNGKAYVEYLTQADRLIINSIPVTNWQIAAYRLKNNL